MNKKLLIYQIAYLALSATVVFLAWKLSDAIDSSKDDQQSNNIVTEESASQASFVIENSIQDSIALNKPTENQNPSLYVALQNRKTVRSFSDQLLSDQQISNLLWSACGVNREDGKLTSPTARNAQEIEAYLFTPKAIYYYQKESHSLKLYKEGDFRAKAGNQTFFATAPVAIALVGNFLKMENFDEEGKQFYSATDVGYVSQDIYLYCAADGLATVACGNIDRPAILEVLELKDAKPLLSHPIGYEQ